MEDSKKLILKIKKLLENHYKNREETPFGRKKIKIPLMAPSYGIEEILEVLDSLINESVTMGNKVFEFEKLFSEYIGCKYGTMVNSGSSANLLALSVLTNPVLKDYIKRGSEIITPAVTWSTTVSPIHNHNLVPVLVDIDSHNFNISVEQIERNITKKTRAIMLVHLLGNPAKMNEISEIAQRHNLYLIEDSCEAHGAIYGNKKVGSFGHVSTFSFFFSHHISTIEGGILLTNDEEISELSKALRAHGWIRELKNKQKYVQAFPEIDERFLFINYGYNLRPTELQGGFGIHQIKKLETFIEMRRKNAEYWNKNLAKYDDKLILHYEQKNTRHVWFGYPIIISNSAGFDRRELIKFLEKKGIQTRPIMSGNIAKQPMMKLIKHRKDKLENAEFVSKNAFFIGNHHQIGDIEREYFLQVMEEFLKKH